MPFVSLGVVRERLCISEGSVADIIVIWAMKKYGVKSSWTRMISVDKETADWWSCWLYQPMCQLKNGPLLMYLNSQRALIYYGTKREEWKYLKICGIESQFEAVAHIPSLISLKDAVIGYNDVVLNINSRCAGLKLHGETNALFLVEEAWKTDLDLGFSLYSDDDNGEQITGGRSEAAENQA
ncbi:unnamed protein product [Ilex paraguariensis]|uniref:F-box associated domain-containing protein n=1 Tax=Ilex paraguariensis TaxID=185542 RepID=A0ABC8RCL5_9AQUA